MKNRTAILSAIASKNIVIWGARMTGLGAFRRARSRNINVVGFIDSDIAFIGKKVCGLPVIHPQELENFLPTIDNCVILVAVALKEDEIFSQLSKQGMSNIPVYSFQDQDSPYYTIDILSSCNLKCPSCPHSIQEHNVPRGSMTLETFKKVFDKAIKESDMTHLSLYSWGEPFLHPHLDEIIKYVHSYNVAVALSSNLSIKFENRIEKVISTSPDYLKVSLSGFYPKAYENTHTGGNINLVKSNLYRLRYLMDRYKSNTLVDINYHLYRDNSGENLEKIEDLAKELDFIVSKTYALVMPLERVMSHLEGNPDKQTQDLQKNLLVTIDEGIEAASKEPLPKNTCPFRENQININADLSVPICCTVFHREGNIVAPNFLEATTQEINEAKKKNKLCSQCMKLRLPEYNLGFNRKEWDSYAQQKSIIDVGLGSTSPPDVKKEKKRLEMINEFI
ncbi:MAG: radical SAM protein [Legionellaceae bacterium]|nr:radical SAM protein [Legionellaceae bacterium]